MGCDAAQFLRIFFGRAVNIYLILLTSASYLRGFFLIHRLGPHN